MRWGRWCCGGGGGGGRAGVRVGVDDGGGAVVGWMGCWVIEWRLVSRQIGPDLGRRVCKRRHPSEFHP